MFSNFVTKYLSSNMLASKTCGKFPGAKPSISRDLGKCIDHNEKAIIDLILNESEFEALLAPF